MEEVSMVSYIMSNWFSWLGMLVTIVGCGALIATLTPNKSDDRITKLGILSFTWSSEHYGVEHIKEKLKECDLEILNIEFIGEHVYPPLTDFYLQNRSVIKTKLVSVYPSYLEGILHKSLLKMKKVSDERIIDYVLIKCKKVSTSVNA